MQTDQQDTFYGAVLGAGLIAGLRSFSAPAAVSSALAEQTELAAQAAPFLRLLALGEMFADKLPFAPDRTKPPLFAARVLIGAGAGVAVAAAYKRNLVLGALLAAAAAAFGTYAGFTLRKLATDRLGLPDTLVALVEDAAVIAAGRALGA